MSSYHKCLIQPLVIPSLRHTGISSSLDSSHSSERDLDFQNLRATELRDIISQTYPTHRKKASQLPPLHSGASKSFTEFDDRPFSAPAAAELETHGDVLHKFQNLLDGLYETSKSSGSHALKKKKKKKSKKRQ